MKTIIAITMTALMALPAVAQDKSAADIRAEAKEAFDRMVREHGWH